MPATLTQNIPSQHLPNPVILSCLSLPDVTPLDDQPRDQRLTDLVTHAAAKDALPLALDRAMLAVHPRLLARIERRLPADVRSTSGPEDILQETFSDAFRAFSTFTLPPASDAGELFFRWLCTIAEHRIIDVVRAHRALKRGGAAKSVRTTGPADQSTLAPLLELLAFHEHTPSRSASGREVEAALRSALTTLFPAYREALELRYLLGLSPAEVASRLGRTEEAVHKLCSRAIGALREAMGDPDRFISRGG